jgi:hypothetical protein
MHKIRYAIFSFLCAALLLATCAVAAPATLGPADLNASVSRQDDARSVTGTIAAIGENSFTLSLASAISNEAQDTPKAMTFVIDRNTTVDGKLRVGASADVTYRQDNGNYVAINVRVATRTGQ